MPFILRLNFFHRFTIRNKALNMTNDNRKNIRSKYQIQMACVYKNKIYKTINV